MKRVILTDAGQLKRLVKHRTYIPVTTASLIFSYLTGGHLYDQQIYKDITSQFESAAASWLPKLP